MKFKCDRSGRCCKSLHKNSVVLHGKDIIRLYRGLGRVDIFKLLKKVPVNLIDVYVKFDDDEGIISLEKKDGTCVFYDDKCTIYEYRPDICRNYPFNYQVHEIEQDGKTFNLFRLFSYVECEGVGVGDEVDVEDLHRRFEEHYKTCLSWIDFVDKWNKRENRRFEDFLTALTNSLNT